MYIPPFWCGFTIGVIAGMVLIIAITLIVSDMKGEEENDDRSETESR